jgi:hypothetical protein
VALNTCSCESPPLPLLLLVAVVVLLPGAPKMWSNVKRCGVFWPAMVVMMIMMMMMMIGKSNNEYNRNEY